MTMSVAVMESVARKLGRAAPSAATAFTIRDATLEDAEAVARIYNESIKPIAPATPAHVHGVQLLGPGRSIERSRLCEFDVEAMSNWIRHHWTHNRALWVACHEGQPIGWLSYLGMADRPGMACTSELAIYISEAFQGLGLGSRLVGAAVQCAPSMGLDCLMAMIWSGNAASLQLFRSHGFMRWGQLPSVVWAQGECHDMVILGRTCGVA